MRTLVLGLALLTATALPSFAQRTVTLDEFLKTAVEQDQTFEVMLLDALKLQYRETLALPAEDLVLSVRESLSFLFDAEETLDTTIGLEKVFPRIGTEVSAAYTVSEGEGEDPDRSAVTFSIAQPIAENAFGRSTRLLEKITGLEVDVARHQVAEAYEDYLALLEQAYYAWFAAYRDLEIGKSSYRENQKLLDNILEREKSQVALPVDVNKTRLQVLGKKASLIELEEAYASARDVIVRSMRVLPEEELVPSEPPMRVFPDGAFEALFQVFNEQSRTFSILKLLEEKSGLQVDRDADALLPSIDLMIGLEAEGQGYGLEEDEQKAVAGIVLEWPLPGTQEKARHEVSRIELKQDRLRTGNAYHDLYADLRQIYRQVQREQSLLALTDERIQLARSVLEAETENYSFGKITLNDYISSVNTLDNQRFARIRSDQRLRQLVLEWLRLTDQLLHQLP